MRKRVLHAEESQPGDRQKAIVLAGVLGVLVLAGLVLVVQGRHAAEEAPPRVPRSSAILERASANVRAVSFRQIPATVIDTGALRFVPYTSYRAGDYELNVYGDPDAPACFEIGVVARGSKTPSAKQECLDVVLAILTDDLDKEKLRSLGLAEGKVEREGLTFEVTPPTAADAYGGWWISVYDEKALDGARAKPDEIAAISVKEPAPSASSSTAPAAAPAKEEWAAEDYQQARPSAASFASATGLSATPAPADPRTVYVRGYYRKDGTYVRGYTRRGR